MKQPIRFWILTFYGISLIVFTIGSAFPLSRIQMVDKDLGFLFGVISWAMGIALGISITWWNRQMTLFKKSQKPFKKE